MGTSKLARVGATAGRWSRCGASAHLNGNRPAGGDGGAGGTLRAILCGGRGQLGGARADRLEGSDGDAPHGGGPGVDHWQEPRTVTDRRSRTGREASGRAQSDGG